MIVKERTFPRIIMKLEALHRRTLPHHPKYPLIKEEINKRTAGYKGETALDYPLNLLDPEKYYILHDLRLQGANSYFQIDTMLLSTKFVLIIEVKNLAGTIYFDHLFNQLIQLKSGVEIAYPDPIIQIRRQEEQLKNWIFKNKLPILPIFSLIVISNDRTIIRTSPENRSLNEKVIHQNLLPTKITALDTAIRNDSYKEKHLKKMIRLLKKHHMEADVSILERMGIEKEEILKGVICGKCNFRPLRRKHGTWFCSACKSKDPLAHVQAIKDYQLLLNSSITNRELREYLGIQSSYVATRLLGALNLPSEGSNKGRKYFLSNLEK